MKLIPLFIHITSLTVLCTVLSDKADAQTHYELILLDSGHNGTAYGINESGYSCGYRIVGEGVWACVWTPAGEAITLPGLREIPTDGVALSINDNDDIVVTYSDDWLDEEYIYRIGEGYSVIWDFDNKSHWFISSNIVAQKSKIFDINNLTEICGSWNQQAYVYNIYDQSDKSDYDSSSLNSQAFAINNEGNAVGMLTNSSGKKVPLFIERFSDGSHEEISGLSISGDEVEGFATAINDSNQVVGGGPNGGFYWEPKTDKKFLFEAGTHFYDINNAGVIVGQKELQATIWEPSDSTHVQTNLNKFSLDHVTLQIALAINGKGQIVGRCLHDKTGERGAFLLTPVQEVEVSIQRIAGSSGADMVRLSWSSERNTAYRVKFSKDLKQWENYPAAPGTKDPTIYKAAMSTSSITVPLDRDEMFFKVLRLAP